MTADAHIKDGRPVIGVTTMELEIGGRKTQFVHSDYIDAVVSAGGLPLLVAPMPGVQSADVLSAIDGLLLTGGGDVSPSCYGEDAAPETAGTDLVRDTAEIGLVQLAVEAGVPTLCICRGCQVLNVALGGTLRQNVGVAHLVADRRTVAVHAVTVEPGSLLAHALGSSGDGPVRLGVNSIHHQGIDRLAPVLVAVAKADDGLIESVAHEGAPLLGVQWHPENMLDQSAQRGLFRWLVDRSRPSRRPGLAANQQRSDT